LPASAANAAAGRLAAFDKGGSVPRWASAPGKA